ncbi:MAG: histidine kinase dimerization/phospho-acceptor domain-containing protein [Pseudomonadota bacterium]|nr:histidine kinase dimerization/phospho-acceptor domain-containing protein [Pseudomonadota bacterium]
MDPARTLLDRELLVSGIVHDLRGPLTAIQGFTELYDRNPRPVLAPAIDRMTSLVSTLAETSVSPPDFVQFGGVRVRVRGPIGVLELAIASLPHRALRLELAPEHLAVEISGVPIAEIAAGWSLAQVRLWLAEGGPGLAGARLRIAARIVGALRYSFPLTPGESEGVVHIHLARG